MTARVRPARAGRRGRHPRPPAAQARGLRRHRLRGAQDGPLRRQRGGRRVRRDPGRSSASEFIVTVRHGPATELHEVRDAVEHGSRAPAARARERCCTRSSTASWTTTRPRSQGLQDDIEEVENDVFSAARAQLGRAHLQAQARGARVPPRGRAAGGPVNRLAGGRYELIHPEVREYFRDVNDHLVRVQEQLEGFRELLTSVPDGQPHPGQRAPERGRAQDLGRGGDHRRADHDRRHLRHELRAHARARPGSYGYPLVAGRDGWPCASGCTATSSAWAGSDDQPRASRAMSATVP